MEVRKMSIIYQPRGRAREYSPYALNIYLGCTHNCKYCYAPSCIQKKPESYYESPEPRKDIVKNLGKELSKRPQIKEQVLLSFVGDVYCETKDNNQATREVLELLLEYHVPVAILTKGGERCLNDLGLFKKFGKHIQVGTTLTFDNDKDSLDWEGGAALPEERMATLKILHDHGVRTFASFEPVIKPEQSLNLIEKTIGIVDVYKIGKINNYKGIDKRIDWSKFLSKAVDILRWSGEEFYVKDDLRVCCPDVELYDDEKIADIHNVK